VFTRSTLNKLNNIILPAIVLIQGTKKSYMGQLVQNLNDFSYREAAFQITQIYKDKELTDDNKLILMNNLVISPES
jgi:hypothetical protein